MISVIKIMPNEPNEQRIEILNKREKDNSYEISLFLR